MPEEPTTPSAVETVIEPISTISVHSAPSDSSLQPQVSENPPQEASESAVPKEEPISENHDQTENQKTEISPSVQKPETSTALSETTPSTTPVSSQDSLKRVWSNTL
jgi:hypothetical protein